MINGKNQLGSVKLKPEGKGVAGWLNLILGTITGINPSNKYHRAKQQHAECEQHVHTPEMPISFQIRTKLTESQRNLNPIMCSSHGHFAGLVITFGVTRSKQ